MPRRGVFRDLGAANRPARKAKSKAVPLEPKGAAPRLVLTVIVRETGRDSATLFGDYAIGPLH
jgi:hypothetical protein